MKHSSESTSATKPLQHYDKTSSSDLVNDPISSDAEHKTELIHVNSVFSVFAISLY